MIGEKQAIGNLVGIMKYNFYELVNSTANDIKDIIDYKCDNIFMYDYNLNNQEKERIRKYVENDILVELNNFKMIKVDGILIGTVGVINYEDGKMIDEIFILEEYRNRGIGTDIINNILNKNNKVYLWVYIDNIRAVKLYKRLGFKVKEETDKRYFMERG
jgi:GNAT superfamily N-acetyltransferase